MNVSKFLRGRWSILIPIFIVIWLALGTGIFLLSIISGGAALPVHIIVDNDGIEIKNPWRLSVRNNSFPDFVKETDGSWLQEKRYFQRILIPESWINSISKDIEIRIGDETFIVPISEISSWEDRVVAGKSFFESPDDIFSGRSSFSRFSPFFERIRNYPSEASVAISSIIKSLLFIVIGIPLLFFVIILLNKIFERLPVSKSSPFPVLLFVVVVLSSLAFLSAPGIRDIRNVWIGQMWMGAYEAEGLVHGYTFAGDNYPPLSFVFVSGLKEISDITGWSLSLLYKGSVFLFLTWCSIIVWKSSGSPIKAALFHGALILGTVAHGYTDIFFAPFLLHAYVALKNNRIERSVTWFLFSVLMKWQPVLLIPFLLIYVVMTETDIKKGLMKLLRKVVLPVSAVFALITLIFGWHFPASFLKAMSHSALSYGALNANWVLTGIYKLINPSLWGSASAAWTPMFADGIGPLITRGIFVISFVYLLASQTKLRRKDLFEGLLAFSAYGYLAYVLFNVGVHQNHYFQALLLLILLAIEKPAWTGDFVFWSIISNMNLLLFYGVEGNQAGSLRLFIGTEFVSLFLSIIAIIWWVWRYTNIVKTFQPVSSKPD